MYLYLLLGVRGSIPIYFTFINKNICMFYIYYYHICKKQRIAKQHGHYTCEKCWHVGKCTLNVLPQLLHNADGPDG